MFDMEELRKNLKFWENLTPEELETLFRNFYKENSSEQRQLKSQKARLTEEIVSAKEKEKREELSKERNLLEPKLKQKSNELEEVMQIAYKIMEEAKAKARVANASYQSLKKAYEKVYSMTVQSQKNQQEDKIRLQEERCESERYLDVVRIVEEFVSQALLGQEKGEN